MTTETKLHLPTADELDSGGISDTSWRCKIFLVPAGEREDNTPAVELFHGVGNVGTPMPAFHHRWIQIDSYGPGVVGQSVLDQLEAAADALVELSAAYRGTQFNGHNHLGQWDVLPEELFEEHPFVDPDRLSHYWDAFDWFGPASICWPELCAEASVDPERVLGDGDDWEDVADEVAAIVEPLQAERVSGTAAYARQMAEDYRAERDDAED